MIYAIVAGLLAVWVVGLVSSQSLNGLIHILPATAIAVLLVDFLASRKVRAGHRNRRRM